MTAKLNSRFFSANAIIVIALMMLVYTIYSWVTPYAHDDYMFSRYYLDGNNTALSFKPKKETYLPLPGSLRIG